MGCVLCNITKNKELPQVQEDAGRLNPFYCATPQQLEAFLEELAYDIAASHPEMRTMINKYVRKGVGKEDGKTPKPDPKATQAMRRELCDFAQTHNLVIHPGKGYDYSIESYFMFNRCPCDPARKNCPCPESISEVETTGHCLCRLFWKSNEEFKQQMIGEVT